MTWYLCAAGETFREQVDRRWPKRDKASDGTIGDPSHAARPSDHNPDYSAGGVVRALDLDSDLDPGDPDAMYRLVNQLRQYCKDGKDNRVSYIIYDRQIASGTYQSAWWEWRTYSGSDPHQNHCHISFTKNGDDRGRKFDLRIFTADIRRERRRLTKIISGFSARIRALRVKREAKRKELKAL